jgi:hypothetical protein
MKLEEKWLKVHYFHKLIPGLSELIGEGGCVNKVGGMLGAV